jgi:hypothetical protein
MARAVRTDETDDPAGVDRETHSIKGGVLAVSLG